uniref:CHK kinase-like domain-containing protein n=1 Tax=Heliothis virescens TaxID=7102 RepID=A0A2A4JCB8_HELVI
MTHYNFEGDFASFSENQLEFINKVILEQDIQAKKVFFEVVGQPGDNFVGHVKRLHIEGENGNMKMIVKVAASSELARAATSADITFRNEHIMYTEVLPKLVHLQKAAGVPEEDLLKYAKCYGSLYEPPNETLILEDLKESGYVMLNKHESLSDECVRQVLKNFALLHSLSQVLKNKHPDKYAQITDNMNEVWTRIFNKERFANQAKLVEADVISVLEDDAHINLIKNKVGDFLYLLPKLVNNEDKRYSVIQQGDAHTNNFMFKMDSMETIMIDYQGSNNGNPVFDLLFMLLNCTDHAVRSKHYIDWIDYYHSEFDKSLSNFGLKINLIYPRDKLDADLKRYAKMMFYFGITFNTLLMRDPKEAAEMMEVMKNVNSDKISEALQSHKMAPATRDRIRNRVVGIIDTYKQFGLL